MEPGTEALPADRLPAAAGAAPCIGHIHHQTPVLVFALAYGKDADLPTVQAIAKMTGAHYYDATDPSTIEPVLGDLMTSF